TQISNYNTPDNECVFIPYDSMALLRDIRYPNDIVWTPTNPIFRADAVGQVRTALARAHNFSSTDERAVQIIIFNEFMRIVTTMALALRVLLGFVGTLTLAIGGVGLANIMLVSVTQRTREIGVLKSIGATRRAILFQFLTEALAIVTLGGLIGVLVGYAATVTLGSLPLLGPLFKDKSEQGGKQPERLFREARSAGILSHHNIVTVYDMAEQDDTAYIAMEFVTGATLEQLLNGKEALPGARIFSILRQTAGGLDYAHRRG